MRKSDENRYLRIHNKLKKAGLPHVNIPLDPLALKRIEKDIEEIIKFHKKWTNLVLSWVAGTIKAEWCDGAVLPVGFNIKSAELNEVQFRSLCEELMLTAGGVGSEDRLKGILRHIANKK